MKNISDIDKNFKIETTLNLSDVQFYDVRQEPFSVHGVFYADGKFRRIPQEIAEAVNDGVLRLHSNTAGGRVRFKTNSQYIAIYAKMPTISKMSHMALTGSAGFDLYVREDGKQFYKGTFIPPKSIVDYYESKIDFDNSTMREITINMPLYSDVTELYIGLQKNAKIYSSPQYKNVKPIVFYGSSITQGGCASRPGNSYQGFLERRFDTDYINLGFAGSATGEDKVADYISSLDMSVFIYDYDYNAPDAEHLKNTHEQMFLKIRQAQPDLPIIMMSVPNFLPSVALCERYNIIKTTYNKALNRQDKNVYLIDGPMLMAKAGSEGTVDNTHPNDLGFYSMACAIGDVIDKIL